MYMKKGGLGFLDLKMMNWKTAEFHEPSKSILQELGTKLYWRQHMFKDRIKQLINI
jgi:hypothetical protein